MKHPVLVLAGVLSLVPSSLMAEVRLDVKTAVAMAREHSYSLKGASLDLDVKRTAAQNSYSLFYPSVGLAGTLRVGTADSAGVVLNTNKLTLGASAALSLDPTIALRIRQLWNDYDAGRLTYEQTGAKLAVSVKKYYYALTLSAGQIDLLRKQAEAAARRLETAELKLRLGLISTVDKLSVEYAYKDKLYSLQSVENAYRADLLQLMQVCGIERGATVILTEGVPDNVTAPDVDPASVTGGIDVQLLKATRSAAEITRDTAWAALLPLLTLKLDAGQSWDTDPFADPLFDSGSWQGAGTASLSLVLSVPLDAYLPYSGGVQQALAAREAAVKQAEYAVLDGAENAQRQAETLALTLRQVRSQLESLAVNIAMAEQNLTLVEELYNSGKKSLLDLKDAENALYGARLELINARYDFIAAAIDLGYLAGADLGY